MASDAFAPSIFSHHSAHLMFAVIVSLTIAAARAETGTPGVIELTQLPCQFLESENRVDRGFISRSIEDCEAINRKNAALRLAAAEPLELKAGRYVFRVTNKNVPYEVGFWLRGAATTGRIILPSVSGGGLTPGKTQDYVIDLKPGEYIYSCPLNPTPDYSLVVR
jgi:hypothetical protein